MPLKRTTRKESFALHAGAQALGQRTAHPSRLGQVAQEVVTLLGEGSLSGVAAAKARGVAPGNPKLSKARKSAASIKALADQHATT